jgi:hypothetical protein
MSRKSYTTLTLSVRLAIPAGQTQAQLIAALTQLIQNAYGHGVIIKPLAREVTYI